MACCMFLFFWVKSFLHRKGDRRLNELQNMVGYTHSTTKADADSWLNIDDKDDPRGRVGLEWPWDKSDDESKK